MLEEQWVQISQSVRHTAETEGCVKSELERRTLQSTPTFQTCSLLHTHTHTLLNIS